MNWASQCVAVIPCRNERGSIRSLVRAVQCVLPHVIVVDDDSTDGTAEQAEQAGAEVVRHRHPSGKGAALKGGWQRARERGFAWAMCLDGDGQHAPEDIPRFLEQAEDGAAALIIGNRMAQAHAMPVARRWVNRWMSRRLSVLTGQALPDSQCGFRLVRLAALAGLRLEADHFEVESEMLTRFAAANLAIAFVPVRVIPGARPSRIRLLPDTWRWLRWWSRERFSLRAPVRGGSP